MRLAIATSWYKGITEEQFKNLVNSFSFFNQEETYFYIYCDEAPEDTKKDFIIETLQKYKIKNYKVIQGHRNNNVYYARRKLVNSITQKWCCMIDCDDTFNKDFADYISSHSLKDKYQVYRFKTNLVGNNSMAFTSGEGRQKEFEKGNHLCLWGKIYKTSSIQAAYSLLPKYQFKFIFGEENLVGGLLDILPKKDIPVVMVNYSAGGMSTISKIETVDRFKSFLTGIYITTLDGEKNVYDYVTSRYLTVDNSIKKECTRYFNRFKENLIKISEITKYKLAEGELIPDIEKYLYEEGGIDLYSMLGESFRCIWLPEDK